ncbi:hypothetical protein TD95_004874 [Thielaviopsis punctulata]|uniref:Uncharacterized protein n=1 Tax=Thielaviopsis punctulata TaxID=72032 RepID=A0A0F4ZES6_9PEZI|nr:hypothetical protein TD95_004874 [Thielaviopsis punctulata]
MEMPSEMTAMHAGKMKQYHDEAHSSSLQVPNSGAAQRRRHTLFTQGRRKSIVRSIMDGEENLLLKVDVFLNELDRRLQYIESHYVEPDLDESISIALDTLKTVRSRCATASEEVIGAGRRRLQIMVETIETGYHEAMSAAESVNEKAKVAVELLDEMLNDFENRACKMREQGLASAAGHLVDESLRFMDEGLQSAIHAAESLEDAIQRAVTRARDQGLILYEDLPIPWRINPHIQSGYRFTESKMACIRSMFGLSNETINIWSHAIGFMVVLFIAFYFYPMSHNFQNSSTTDVIIAASFFFTACLTLACSTIWHTMNAVADVEAISIFACIDYTGISVLIAASIATTEWTVFYCDPVSRWLYMTTTAVLGLGGVILPWHPYFNKQEMAWLRVAFFAGLALTGFLPVLQLNYTHGAEFVYEFYKPIFASIGVYFLGALVYASKIPECWYPGMFDYVGGSHNLWHFAVLGGILFHYVAMQEFFSNAFARAQGGCPAY